MTNKKNSAGTVGFIFLAMLMAKVLGQVREMVIASTYGTAWQADAYVAASQIPTNFFDMILGSAVSAAFIPVFNKFLEKDGETRAKKFAGTFFNDVFVLSALISLFGMIFAPQIISILTPNLEPQAATLAIKLLRIMFPMIIFIGSAFTFVGLLQSMGEYNLPAIMSMVSSLVCIVYLFTLEGKFGITGLAVSLVIGWFLQFAILMPSTIKKGFRFNLKLYDKGIPEVVKLALPVLIGTWVQPVNVLVNTRIASSVDGGVSAINYSNKLYLIAAGVFAMALTNYIFPKLSRLSVDEKNRENWFEVFFSSLKTVVLVVTPIAMVFIVQSKDIIRVIYQRGEFDEKSVIACGGALFYYSLGILSFSLQEIFYKSFYSLRKVLLPMVIAFTGIAVNLVLSILLSPFMGINGLALAASVSVTVTATVSFMIIAHNSKRLLNFVLFLFKNLLLGALSGIVIMLVKNILPISCDSFIGKALNLCIPAFAGLIAYLILLFVFKTPELTNLLKSFLKKGAKNEQ